MILYRRGFRKVEGQFLHARWWLQSLILSAQTLLHFGWAKAMYHQVHTSIQAVFFFLPFLSLRVVGPHPQQQLPACPIASLCHSWVHHSQSQLPFPSCTDGNQILYLSVFRAMAYALIEK